MRIYVASSWRNERQPEVVHALRAAGYDVYDFRNPAPGNHGFHWSQIDPNWQSWTADEFVAALQHPIAEDGFGHDMRALDWCDVTVLLLPCGRSAHLEAGYAIGKGKLVLILLDENPEPELMYKMATTCVTSLSELLHQLSAIRTQSSRENGIGVWCYQGLTTYWIAAASRDEADRHYEEIAGESPEDDRVSEIADLDAEELLDLDAEEAETYITYRTLIQRHRDFPATIGSDNY